MLLNGGLSVAAGLGLIENGREPKKKSSWFVNVQRGNSASNSGKQHLYLFVLCVSVCVCVSVGVLSSGAVRGKATELLVGWAYPCTRMNLTKSKYI